MALRWDRRPWGHQCWSKDLQPLLLLLLLPLLGLCTKTDTLQGFQGIKFNNPLNRHWIKKERKKESRSTITLSTEFSVLLKARIHHQDPDPTDSQTPPPPSSHWLLDAVGLHRMWVFQQEVLSRSLSGHYWSEHNVFTQGRQPARPLSASLNKWQSRGRGVAVMVEWRLGVLRN